MFEKYSEIFSKMDLFQGIEQKVINTMLDCMKPKYSFYKRNDYIINLGDQFDSVGIMLNGEAIVIKENAAGNRVVMTLLKRGDIFGEMLAFSNHAKWPATVQAQDNCEVLFLPKFKIIGECNRLCSWHTTLIQNFLKIISERALMLNKKVEYLTIKSMRGKISTYLLEQYKKAGNSNFVLLLNRNELADFFNVSRPSMSREMCKMRDEGVIDFYLNAFKILDLEALKMMSDS
jgi:CRP-like cAMP-binding protein